MALAMSSNQLFFTPSPSLSLAAVSEDTQEEASWVYEDADFLSMLGATSPVLALTHTFKLIWITRPKAGISMKISIWSLDLASVSLLLSLEGIGPLLNHSQYVSVIAKEYWIWSLLDTSNDIFGRYIELWAESTWMSYQLVPQGALPYGSTPLCHR